MANLNGQNIGTNYKGIINIGSTINQNVSASLQSLTDGDGNNLPIKVSTSQTIIGGGSSTGRLVVRGDGANPIYRFENSGGSSVFSSNAAGNVHTMVGELSVSDVISTGATRQFFISTRLRLAAPSDGVGLLMNNAQSDFNRLNFGGNTSSFPSIKRSTTSLQARLADDSNFTNIQGKITTETNYTAGAIVPTGYLTLYDATGTAYKIPAVL